MKNPKSPLAYLLIGLLLMVPAVILYLSWPLVSPEVVTVGTYISQLIRVGSVVAMLFLGIIAPVLTILAALFVIAPICGVLFTMLVLVAWLTNSFPVSNAAQRIDPK